MSGVTYTMDFGDIGEHECIVRFRYHRGYDQTLELPGEPECVELMEIKTPWGFDALPLISQREYEIIADHALDHLKDFEIADYEHYKEAA